LPTNTARENTNLEPQNPSCIEHTSNGTDVEPGESRSEPDILLFEVHFNTVIPSIIMGKAGQALYQKSQSSKLGGEFHFILGTSILTLLST
jgi:hypothetical protein